MTLEDMLSELERFLAIPSISADPSHAADVRAAGEWVCDFVRAAGGTCELVDGGDHPLAIGEIQASVDPGTAPTVMVYGHFDVQPPGEPALWASEPFEPTLRGGRVYARGVADNKGQLYMLLRALADLAAEGALPVNVRICCDGEEETGGTTVVDFLEADARSADVCVIFDFPYQDGRPAFMVATRGMIYLHVRVRTGTQDLHSGLFGGVALNAVHALMAALAPTLARAGRLPEPLRAGVAAPTTEELDSWKLLRGGSDELASAGATAMDERVLDDYYVRTWAEPTVEVNGIAGGEAELQKTVLPVEAHANVSLRLAPGQDVDEIAAVFERLVRDALPAGAELEVERWAASAPGVVDVTSRAFQLGLDAFERALGERPLLVRAGGSLPIAPALTAKGIPAIMTGFLPQDCNAHAPNESMPLESLEQGLKAARELFVVFGEL
jgi:acetylornithine deacetylase/succinyl-diaminopimelate desuccinylase-like protein